jgi:hypothetical protein
MVLELLFAGLIGFVFVYNIDALKAIIIAANDESRAVADELRRMGLEMK